MKKDYKIGMLAGLILVMLIGAWLGLRGRSPRPGYAQGQPPAGRMEGPDQTRPGLVQAPVLPPAGGQPAPGTYAQTARPEPNAVTSRTLGAPPSSLGQTPALSLPQGQPVQASAQPTAPAAVTPARMHTVREGETLSDISDRYYDNPNLWDKIVRANRSVIRDPDRIYPGMRLEIPD